jgi:hypothetical protein
LKRDRTDGTITEVINIINILSAVVKEPISTKGQELSLAFSGR